MTIHRGVVVMVTVLTAGCFLVAQDTPPPGGSVNQNSVIVQDFQKSLNDYLKLHKRVQAALPTPKPGSSATDIKQYQQFLAQGIRAERAQARQGDIFTPPVSQLFRQLIVTPFRSSDAGKIRASLRHAEPVQGLKLEINQEYPQATPLQSTPPTLLMDLPKLPKELEYRLVGRELILLDNTSNLVVDLLPDALPTSQGGR
jgi:hypothetical protein